VLAASPQNAKYLEVFEDRIECLVAPMTMMRDPVMVSQQNEDSNSWITSQIRRDGFVSQIFTFPKF